MSDWWPITDAAQFVDVDRRKIARWAHEGRLTQRESDTGVTLINLHELAELLEHRGRGGRLPKAPRRAAT